MCNSLSPFSELVAGFHCQAAMHKGGFIKTIPKIWNASPILLRKFYTTLIWTYLHHQTIKPMRHGAERRTLILVKQIKVEAHH